MTHQVKLNKTGAFVGKTYNHDKIAGKVKCVSETGGVKERQTTGDRRSDRKCKKKAYNNREEKKKRKREIIKKENK